MESKGGELRKMHQCVFVSFFVLFCFELTLLGRVEGGSEARVGTKSRNCACCWLLLCAADVVMQ